MKTGRSLVDLATELERQRDVKRDFIAGSAGLTMADDLKVTVGDSEPMPLTQHATGQLAQRLEVPKPFFDRLATKHPDLLAGMVNQLFRREPQQMMVRTLDSTVRALVSNKFRTLDNYDLFDAVAPVLIEAGAQISSCELTERKMYIKALCPWLDRELPMPEGYEMGVGHNIFVRKVTGAITIANSEVGVGRLVVAPGVFEKQCTNLATFKDESYGKMHVGKRKGASGEDDDVYEYLSDTTKRMEDAVVWARVRDVVKATMDGRVIDNIVAKMTAARGDAIVQDPAKVVEVFAKRERMTEDEKGGLLRHLTQSGEMTRYGLQWAVTRLAGEVEDYDRATELEELGGRVIELPRSEWTTILKAAA